MTDPISKVLRGAAQTVRGIGNVKRDPTFGNDYLLPGTRTPREEIDNYLQATEAMASESASYFIVWHYTHKIRSQDGYADLSPEDIAQQLEQAASEFQKIAGNPAEIEKFLGTLQSEHAVRLGGRWWELNDKLNGNNSDTPGALISQIQTQGAASSFISSSQLFSDAKEIANGFSLYPKESRKQARRLSKQIKWLVQNFEARGMELPGAEAEEVSRLLDNYVNSEEGGNYTNLAKDLITGIASVRDHLPQDSGEWAQSARELFKKTAQTIGIYEQAGWQGFENKFNLLNTIALLNDAPAEKADRLNKNPVQSKANAQLLSEKLGDLKNKFEKMYKRRKNPEARDIADYAAKIEDMLHKYATDTNPDGTVSEGFIEDLASAMEGLVSKIEYAKSTQGKGIKPKRLEQAQDLFCEIGSTMLGIEEPKTPQEGPFYRPKTSWQPH